MKMTLHEPKSRTRLAGGAFALGEAVLAIDRTVSAGFKRDFAFLLAI